MRTRRPIGAGSRTHNHSRDIIPARVLTTDSVGVAERRLGDKVLLGLRELPLAPPPPTGRRTSWETHVVARRRGPDATLLAEDGGLRDLAGREKLVVDVGCGP